MTREEAINIIRDTYYPETELKALEVLIPELRESDDERIRKSILRKMRACQKQSNFFSEEEIAWLEKQKKLFEPGSGLYYYDGEKTTYLGYPSSVL